MVLTIARSLAAALSARTSYAKRNTLPNHAMMKIITVARRSLVRYDTVRAIWPPPQVELWHCADASPDEDHSFCVSNILSALAHVNSLSKILILPCAPNRCSCDLLL